MKIPGAGDLFAKKAPPPAVTRAQALQVYPVRNPSLEWELDEEGLVRAKLVRSQDLKTRVVAGLLSLPDARGLKLDEVGSFVWSLCDGEHTLGDIVETMMEKYKLGWREVEVSLNDFMRTLGKRGMIAVAVPQEVAESMDPQVAKALGLSELEILKDKPPTDAAEGESQET